MERRKPACAYGFYGTDHSAAAHVSHHYFPTEWGEALMCPGWSEREDDAAALVMRLDQVAIDHEFRLPPGMRVECHPLVYRGLQDLFIPSCDEFVTSMHTGEEVFKPQVPVMITAGMERGQWRIVADEGQIAEGVVRDG